MSYDNEIEDKMQDAIQRIEELREMRSKVLSYATDNIGFIDMVKIQQMVNVLNDVEVRSTQMINDVNEQVRELTSRDGESDSSGIGDWIGSIGSYVSSAIKSGTSAGQAVIESAIPFTQKVLGKVSSITNTLTNTSSSVETTLRIVGNNTTSNMLSYANNMSNSIVAQTANASNLMTTKVTNTLLGLGASPTYIQNVLTPVNGMVVSNSGVASGVVYQAQTSANNLKSGISSVLSTMSNNTKGTVSKVLGIASNVAQVLLGSSTGTQYANAIFNGTSTSGIQAVSGQGLFGVAAQTATTSPSSITSTLTTLASNVSGALKSGSGGGLVNSLLSGVANVAGGLASATTSVVGQTLSSTAKLGSTLLGASGNVASSLVDAASNVGKGLFNAIGDIASSAMGKGDTSVLGSLANLAGTVLGSTGDLAGSIVGAAKSVAGGLVDTIGDISGSLMDSIGGLVGSLMGDTIQETSDAVEEVGDSFEDLFDEAQQLESNGDEYSPLDDLFNQDDDRYDDSLDDLFDTDSEDSSTSSLSSESSPNATTTSQGSEEPLIGGSMYLKEDVNKEIGWKGFPFDWQEGLIGMMHDGDQQLFNPYGAENADWTMYSFRPADAEQGYPQIAITPSSFQALDSMDTMLNQIPYVVVKEYFFKNVASTMISFVKKIKAQAKEAANPPPKDDGDDSQGAAGAKESGNSFMDKVKKAFAEVELKEQVIDIPYILYCCLREKLFGNTYIFPYIVSSSTIINSAANSSEWGKDESVVGKIKDMMNNAFGMVAGLAAGMTGSQAKGANLFPAPTWQGPGEDKVSFSFDLILINDNVVKTRNNYMCVNTIINNNRSLQKAILAFPGALYELWLPTGQRHLMCTGEFKLYPLGLNRKTPTGFFTGGHGPGASFKIGTEMGSVQMKNPHKDEDEVIPDAYKLSMTFTSCLANNLNTSVFQYYVDMTSYSSPGTQPPGQSVGYASESKLADDLSAKQGATTTDDDDDTPDLGSNDSSPGGGNTVPESKDKSIAREFVRAINELVDSSDTTDQTEKFEESTYNKKLGRLKSSLGDLAINADSVIQTIRNTQKVISESKKFLSKLYDAENNNLWFRPFEKEEYYTTLNPNYRQILIKQYGDRLQELKAINLKITQQKNQLSSIQDDIIETIDLFERESLLEQKVNVSLALNDLQIKRDELVDGLLQTSTDLVQTAFDVRDDIVSVKKQPLTTRIFKQVWNEKIMNSYERDRVQYMTSKEKERYFKSKVKELKKYDQHGILNHPDWFFRVTVLDFIVIEMQRLISWFKSCTYEDFETIYKIIRKLNLLKLDIDCVYDANNTFDINHTNLFYIAEQDTKTFTKIDGMLTGNTLYELFQAQVKLNFTKEKDVVVESNTTPTIDKELIKEQTSEMDYDRRRAMRMDVVNRVWGSEDKLTKAAYDDINENPSYKVEIKEIDFNGTIGELKDRIIQLKLIDKNEAQDNELRILLGSLTNFVRVKKEELVIKEAKAMSILANSIIQEKSNDINAPIM